MTRREIIALLSATAISCPFVARAQRPKSPVIGYLGAASLDQSSRQLAAFRQGLREAGFVEGQNVAVEYRFAEGKYDRLPMLAADLAHLQVAVICTPGGTAAALAAKAATQSIPIVFAVGTNPVEAGLVASLNRPGGNATGMTILAADLVAKRIEIIHELVPGAQRIALLVNPTSRAVSEAEQKEAALAAHALALQLRVLNVSDEGGIAPAFAKLAAEGTDGILVGSDLFLLSRRDKLVEAANRHEIPTLYPFRLYTMAGGLMSYGADEIDAIRQIAVYAGRILKGDSPATLPVQQSTRVELVINQRTAKSLGLSFPLSLLGRADEVIE